MKKWYFWFRNRLHKKKSILSKQHDGLVLANRLVRRRQFFQRLMILLILASLVYISYSMWRFLKEPTLHEKAVISLLEFLRMPDTEKADFIEKMEKKYIYIWPQEGIRIQKDFGLGLEIISPYIEEFHMLESAEKKMFLNRSLKDLEENVLHRLEASNWFPEKLLPTIKSYAFEEQFLDRTNYVWDGFKKTMHYILLEKINLKNEIETREFYLYLSSVSSIADKTKLLRDLYPPLLILLISFLTYALLNRIINEERTNIVSYKSKVYRSQNLQELVNFLAEEVKRIYGKNYHSLSLQIFYQNYYNLILENVADGNDCNIQILEKNDENQKRMEEIDLDRKRGEERISESIFETFYYQGKYGYSVVLPIIQEKKVIGLLDINLLLKPVRSNLSYNFVEFYHELNEKITGILTIDETERSEVLSNFRTILGELTGVNRADAFRIYLERILEYSPQSPLLPNFKEFQVYAFHDKNPDFGTLLPHVNREIEHKIPYSSNMQCIIETREEELFTYLPFRYSDGEYLICFSLSDQKAIITESKMSLIIEIIQLFIENLHSYEKDNIRQIARDFFLLKSTNLKEDVLEIIEQEIHKFFLKPENRTKSYEEIRKKLQEVYSKGITFEGQGFGVLFEMDLFASSTIFTQQNETHKKWVQDLIQTENRWAREAFQADQDSFIRVNQSGGDGDAMRHFITTRNTRIIHDQVISAKQKITKKEKEWWMESYLEKIQKTLTLIYLSGVPMKLSCLVINEANPLQLKVMDGQFNIQSFTKGHYLHSRIAKGFRSQGNSPQLCLGVNVKKGGTKIEMLMEKIMQPFKAVLSLEFTSVLPNNQALQWNIFDTESFDSSQEKKEVGNIPLIEVGIKKLYPYHRFCHALHLIPPQFSLEEWMTHLTSDTYTDLDSFGLRPIKAVIVKPGQVFFVKDYSTDPSSKEREIWKRHLTEKLYPRLKKEMERAQQYIELELQYHTNPSFRATSLKELNTLYMKSLDLCRAIPLPLL